MKELAVKIKDVEFKNPVLLASGTVGYGDEIARFCDLNQIGGIVTKSLSLKPRKGNPPQRIVETASGMLNAIGLANVGVDEFVKNKLPNLAKYDTKVICNIAASSPEEYVECTRILTTEKEIDGFEINVSCPNVKDGGLEFGNNIDAVKRVTSGVRNVTDKLLIVKLSPNVARISDFARAVKESGGDAVSAINTLVGTAIDIYTRRPKLFNITGGLSGPAIKPVALAKVLEIKRNVDIPVIGIGGITTWQDIIEFMIAGASCIQLGTINFISPDFGSGVIPDLLNFCNENKIENISHLTGSVLLP